MMSLLRLAALASLLPLSSLATDQSAFNAYEELQRFRIQDQGAGSTFSGTTGEFLAQFLVDPSSPYSNLVEEPLMFNQIWWPSFVEDLDSRFPDAGERFLGTLQWQMGMTKARPGVEVVVDDAATANYKGREAAANALKAEVDPDIFWKARDMNGSHYAQAAGEAVALQILREQIRRNDPATHAARAIRPEVLERYLAQTHPEEIPSRDREYLGDLLRSAITTMPSFRDGASRTGLPAVYRIARTAAAYADADGYLTVGGLCNGVEPRADLPNEWPTHAEPLCFIAANDRSVRAWYRQQLNLESIRRPPPSEQSGLSHVMHWIVAALLFADFAASIEIADAFLAEDMLADGAITDEDAALAGQRAQRLTCGVRP